VQQRAPPDLRLQNAVAGSSSNLLGGAEASYREILKSSWKWLLANMMVLVSRPGRRWRTSLSTTLDKLPVRHANE